MIFRMGGVAFLWVIASMVTAPALRDATGLRFTGSQWRLDAAGGWDCAEKYEKNRSTERGVTGWTE
jgi:hypothetical protein